MTDIVDLEKAREERDWKDSPLVYTAPDGVKWYTFGVEYNDGDAAFCVNIWAKDWADAERRLDLIRTTSKVYGKIHSEIPSEPWR